MEYNFLNVPYHYLLIRPVVCSAGNTPVIRKLVPWVTGSGLALVDELRGEEVSSHCATQHSSDLALVTYPCNRDSFCSFQLNCPRRSGYYTDSCLIPV